MSNKHTDKKHVFINGTIYDLTHLNDFIYKFETDKNIFNIFVYFSCHCFSDEKLKYNQNLKFSCCNSKNLSELRGFCIHRYNDSLKIKEHIIDMVNKGRVYFADKQNYMIIPHTKYTIFFTLENKIESNSQINLFIQSAYFKKDVIKDRDNNIPFDTLVQKIYNYEKIDFKSKKNR
ncbi:MAG: hypothetical protein H7263_13505 [Candidatus Sericytochromatia bacterium]|nr:hypothetical protein [Candidatus Sericytochromatia bacterium]